MAGLRLVLPAGGGGGDGGCSSYLPHLLSRIFVDERDSRGLSAFFLKGVSLLRRRLSGLRVGVATGRGIVNIGSLEGSDNNLGSDVALCKGAVGRNVDGGSGVVEFEDQSPAGLDFGAEMDDGSSFGLVGGERRPMEGPAAFGLNSAAGRSH